MSDVGHRAITSADTNAKKRLAAAIARSCNCEPILVKSDGGYIVNVVGAETDAENVLALWSAFRRTVSLQATRDWAVRVKAAGSASRTGTTETRHITGFWTGVAVAVEEHNDGNSSLDAPEADTVTAMKVEAAIAERYHDTGSRSFGEVEVDGPAYENGYSVGTLLSRTFLPR